MATLDEPKNQIQPTQTEDIEKLPFSVNNVGGDYDDFTTPASWAVVSLPRYILLKGDNGKYLRTVEGGNNGFTGDKSMDGTIFEVKALPDGAVGIKSTFNNKFLGRFPTSGITDILRIRAEFTESDLHDYRNRFWSVKMGRATGTNQIGLIDYHSRGWQVRWRRREDGLLVGGDGDMTGKRNVFELEEPVTERQIYGIQYHMMQANNSGHEPVTSVTKDVKNWSDSPQKGVLSFTHTETESQSWGGTDSWKVSASVGISVRIPFVGKTSVTTEGYYSGAYQWGEAQETTKEISSQLEVEVPPKSMVQATMIVQKGKLEVPFSYAQSDTLYNGNSFPSTLHDGIFTGVNTYVTFHTVKQKLA